MKILKDNSYNLLINEIEALKGENEFLKEEREYLAEELKKERILSIEIQKDFCDYIADSKVTFSIRRLVLGKKASGKTTFIKYILPKIASYFVIDTTGEYKDLPKENRLFVDLSKKYDVSEILKVINENKEKLIIIDGASLTITPDWFMLNSRGLNFIVVDSFKKPYEKHLDDVDFIYDFGTLDDFRFITEIDKTKMGQVSFEKQVFNTEKEIIDFAAILASFGYSAGSSYANFKRKRK